MSLVKEMCVLAQEKYSRKMGNLGDFCCVFLILILRTRSDAEIAASVVEQ